MVLDLRLLLLHTTDAAETRSLPQQSCERVESGRWTSGVDFDAPIVQVDRISGQVQRRGGFLGEIPVAHALNMAANQPAPGGLGGCRHGLNSNPVYTADG